MMAPEHISSPSAPDLSSPQAKPLPPWARPFAFATAVVYCISLAFPVIAGLSRDTAAFPQWWGLLDVVIAFVLAGMAFVLTALAQNRVTRQAEDATYRAYRTLSHGILALLVVFFLFGDRIVWINGLPGLAWRTWLLFYALPAWFTTVRSSAGSSRVSHPA